MSSAAAKIGSVSISWLTAHHCSYLQQLQQVLVFGLVQRVYSSFLTAHSRLPYYCLTRGHRLKFQMRLRYKTPGYTAWVFGLWHNHQNISTLCLKKSSHFKLSVTLSNLNRFSKFFTLLESVYNLQQNPYDIIHLTSGMLLHYVGKLNIQIFCRYSGDMAEMQTNCILIASNFVIHHKFWYFWCWISESFPILTANTFFIKVLSSSLNTMLIVDKHCSDVCGDQFPVPQIDRKSKQANEQWL